MSREMYYVVAPLVIVLLFFWLLYRITRKITSIIRNKVMDELPYMKTHLDNFQQKIDYLDSRMEALEHRVNELVNKSQK